MKNINFKMVLVLVLIIVGVVYFFDKSSNDEKISELGQYRGYSEKIYDGHIRRSEYLTLTDGTRLDHVTTDQVTQNDGCNGHQS